MAKWKKKMMNQRWKKLSNKSQVIVLLEKGGTMTERGK
jgi:hypothetical protein